MCNDAQAWLDGRWRIGVPRAEAGPDGGQGPDRPAATASYAGRYRPPRGMAAKDADNAEHDTCGKSDAFPCGVLGRQIGGVDGWRLIQIYTLMHQGARHGQ